MLALGIVKLLATFGHVANGLVNETPRQRLRNLVKTCDVLGTGLTFALGKFLLLRTHFARDLLPQGVVAHTQVRTARGDLEHFDLGLDFGGQPLLGRSCLCQRRLVHGRLPGTPLIR